MSEQPEGSAVKAWEILSSKSIHKDRWISLRADECVGARGQEIAPYYVLEYPDWVSVLALTPERKVLVLREYRHGPQETLLGLVGGGGEGDETPIETGARELREETGYTSDQLTNLGFSYANWGTHTNKVHCVLAENCVKVAEPELDPNEAIDCLVVPLEEVLEPGYLQQSFHQAHLWMAHRQLGLG